MLEPKRIFYSAANSVISGVHVENSTILSNSVFRIFFFFEMLTKSICKFFLNQKCTNKRVPFKLTKLEIPIF